VGVTAITWQPNAEGRLAPYIRGREDVRVAWAPQPGSQDYFLRASWAPDCVREVLYESPRGPGKTDALLMAFAQHVGRGFGADWRGIIFRRTFPELSDIIAKSQRWFGEMFPKATYNQSAHTWRWPTGEVLIFSYMERPSDYYRYHGHAYPFIGWEELTTWSSDECYRSMFSCLRSTNPRVPRMVRATTNPYGRGHNFVKARFGLPLPTGVMHGPIIRTPGQPDRQVVHGRLEENQVLLHAEPNYIEALRASASNPAQAAAWIEGSWDIVAGGMFDDLWRRDVHVIPPIPPDRIPRGWRMDRSYDDGQSRPFSVGWWAQSNGEPIEWEGRVIGPVRGDLVRIAEWYGWNGQPNKGLQLATSEIAKGVVAREQELGIRGRVRPGPADTSIWNADPKDPRSSIASEMLKHGVSWERADKGPGSRKQGWQLMRELMKGAIPSNENRREKPGLFISAACEQALRTIPTLPRDDRDPDDVDTEAEDHCADEMRMRIRRPRAVETKQSSAIY
jgi:hypothetical protein